MLCLTSVPENRRSFLYISGVSFAIFLLNIFSPSSVHTTPLQKEENKLIEYILDTTVDGVQMQYAVHDCSGEQVVLLKLQNTNHHAVKVRWSDAFITRQVAEKTFGTNKEITIPAATTLSVSCDEIQNSILIIRAASINPAYKSDIKGFQFSNAAVLKI